MVAGGEVNGLQGRYGSELQTVLQFASDNQGSKQHCKKIRKVITLQAFYWTMSGTAREPLVPISKSKSGEDLIILFSAQSSLKRAR
jgi:hypothetical protein